MQFSTKKIFKWTLLVALIAPAISKLALPLSVDWISAPLAFGLAAALVPIAVLPKLIDFLLGSASSESRKDTAQSKALSNALHQTAERQLTLNGGKQQITLFIDSPTGLDPLDDYREVNFALPESGRHRAVFFLLPGQTPDASTALKPANEFEAPVQWDDPTMLFVPDLSDDSILAAIRYIIDKGQEQEAFENEDDIRRSDSP